MPRLPLWLPILLLAACSSDPQPEARAEQAANQMAAPSAPPAQPVNASDAPQQESHPDVAVEAEGLRFFTATGAARALPFGTLKEGLLGALESVRGPADGGSNPECGAGLMEYAAWADGLTLHFQDGRFVGWALDERAEGAHSTAGGIGPGSTRAQLESIYEAAVEETSLGQEFSAGELHGVLSGTAPDARITAMWAGTTCIFR